MNLRIDSHTIMNCLKVWKEVKRVEVLGVLVYQLPLILEIFILSHTFDGSIEGEAVTTVHLNKI